MKFYQTIKWLQIKMWHSLLSEISDYFKFIFFKKKKKIEFNGSFH